jgi:predicted nucleic acid-binding protein
MARKTTGNVTSRGKKTETTAQPATVETSPVATTAVTAAPAITPVTKEARKVEKTATVTAINRGQVNLNLEEAIRRRAYELYLERRATAGAKHGDESQDWLIAEREIRSRDSGHGQHTA